MNMKKTLLSIVLCLATLPLFSQIMFQKGYGEFFTEYCRSMVRTSGGGYCLVGSTGPAMTDSLDALIVRTDIEGSPIWSARLSGTKDDELTGITTTDDGSYIVVGNTFSSPLDPTHTDILVMKVDDGGFVYWSKTLGGNNTDRAHSVIRSGDGSYIVFGSTLSYGTAAESGLIMKIDDLGNQIWTSISSTNASNVFYSGARTPDGGFVAAGSTTGSNGQDHYITKTDSTGNILWSQTHSGNGDEYLSDITNSASGGFIACGKTTPGGAGNADMCVLALDANGGIVWQFTYGSAEDDQANSVRQLSNGNILTGGTTNIGTSSQVINQASILMLDSTGTILWSNTYGDISVNSYGTSVLDAQDGFAIAGTSELFDPPGDFYLVKTDLSGESGCYNNPVVFQRNSGSLASSSGANDTLGIIDEFSTTLNPVTFTNQFSQSCFTVGMETLTDIERFNIFPNPAKDYITLKLAGISKSGEIIIRDITGREIQSQAISGSNQIRIPVHKLSSGMYFVNLISNEEISVKSFLKD
jgi:hypothetical protein